MTSEALPLSIRSDPDVQITIFDAAGVERSIVSVGRPVLLPRGLYRIRLERCGFVHEELILHDSASPRELDAPLVESPAPVDIAADSDRHGSIARRLSVREAGPGVTLGDGQHDARLFVFVRRMSRAAHDAVFPSEPVSVHDLTGRRLAMLAPDPVEQGRDLQSGYVAASWKVTPGSYRLRVGHLRRDLTITVPAGRAAHVFLADRGTISLRTARVYLPLVDAAFDPGDEMAFATESVLWALSQPGGELPPIAHHHLPHLERDLSFGIACAHVLRRQGDRAALDQVMRALTEHAPRTPDVEILSRAWRGQSAASGAALALPPLFRASFVLALEEAMPVGPRSALVEAAKAAHGDSVWCTWSPRWWDERWIEPTVDRWRGRRDGAPATIEAIARATRLPAEIVEQAFVRLDAASPRTSGSPASVEQISVPGYQLRKQLGRGERSTVYAAHRTSGGGEVSLEIIPAGARGVTDTDARALHETLARFAHPRMLACSGIQALPDGSALCLELELCRESLFDRLASRGRPLGYDEACAVVLQALEALGVLHDRGLVHGNIHPGNLFIRTDGTAVLGLPAMASQGFAAGPASATGSDDDRTRFLAPECVGEGGACSAASDTWSIAATLYFLLTLELPRERYTDQGEAEAARANPVTPIADRLSELPAVLVDCLGIALSEAPARRFGDGEALQDALRGAVPAARAALLHDELVHRDPAYAATLCNVFLRLTTLTRGEPAWVARDDLRYDDAAENARVQQILDRFQAAGLITTGTDAADPDGADRECVRLAHHELLHGWTRIRTWHDELDAVPDTRSLLVALGHAVRRWQRGTRRRSLLWSDQRITLAREIRRERRFLYNTAESEFVRRSGHRRVTMQVGFSGVTLAFLVVTGCMVWQRGPSGETAVARKTQETLARSLQDHGRQSVVDGRPLQALPYLVEAGMLADAGPALQMLVHEASRGLPIVPALDHKAEVRRAAFSPDGSRIVTGSADGTADVWDATTGKRVASLMFERHRAHAAAVVSVAFSPDGRRIVTASLDWTAAIWNADTGSRQGKVLRHDGIVQDATFSPDGKYVLTASVDRSARIWNAETGALVHELDHLDTVETAAFNFNGTRVVTASADRTARIWTAATGVVEHTLRHQGTVWSAEFSADGTRVVTASQDRTARIWDTATGELLRVKSQITGKETPLELEHRDGVTAASFDLSGAYVVTTSDKGARVWDATTGVPVTQWLEHQGKVNGAAFSPSGGRLITVSADGAGRIWDTATGRMQLPLLEHTGPVNSAMFSADGKRVITAGADRAARIWDVSGGMPPVMLDFRGLVLQAAFSSDGRRMVTANDDATVRIWDTATGKLEHSLPQPAMVRSIAFNLDGTRIVTTDNDRRARIWDAATGEIIIAISLPAVASSATFSPDGARLIATTGGDAVSWEGMLGIWDVQTGAPVPLALEYADNTVSASLDRSGTHLITLNRGGMARVWDARTGKAIGQPLMHPDGAVSAAINPDGTQVVTAGKDSTARVWDIATGKEAAPALEHDQHVIRAAFSPDGARIVTISGERTAQVWDARTGKPLTPQLPTEGLLVSVAFSADGERLLAADRHSVSTWDVALDTRAPKQWSELTNKSPYVLDNGVLVLRELVSRPDPRDLHDDLVLSF